MHPKHFFAFLLLLLTLLSLLPNDVEYTTAKSGRYSDANTWHGKKVPPAYSKIRINPKHTLTVDRDIEVRGIYVPFNATLTFESKKSSTISSTKNIVIEGRLVAKPVSHKTIHTIRFVDINEARFIGGGSMEIMDSDVGLWVTKAGVVALQGTPKTPYTRLKGAANKGDKIIELSTNPMGWQVGDELSIAPNSPPDSSDFYTGFDVVHIVSVKGNIVTLDKPLQYNHIVSTNPFNETAYTAEVLNLTRNVRIEGTGDGSAKPENNGRAHTIFLMVKNPQEILYTQFQSLGARRYKLDGYTEPVLGRYPIHFHHCLDGTQGTIIEGVVIKNGTRGVVPHASNGIKFKSVITFNTFETPYWWDFPPDDYNPINNSNDISYDSCVAAKIKCDPPFRGYRMAGISIGAGLRNSVENCIVIGNEGNQSSAGFVWEESANYLDNLWIFNKGNIAHNNKHNGIFSWQNDPNNHVINDFVAYNNGATGIEHGAYVNAYKFRNIYLFNNGLYGFRIHATPIRTGVPDEEYPEYISVMRNTYSTQPLLIDRHTIAGNGAMLIKDCRFSKVIVSELPRRAQIAPGLYDMINCELTPKDFEIKGMEEGSTIRVQNSNGTAFQIKDGECIEINKFFKP